MEINANLMENDFRIKKINAKEEVEFLIKEINAIKTQLVAEIKGEDIDITSDRRGEVQERKSPSSLLFQPISPSSLLFGAISPSTLNLD